MYDMSTPLRPPASLRQLASGWQKTSGINRDDYMVNPVSKENITIDHILAAEFIQKAYRRFLECRQAWERDQCWIILGLYF